MRIRHVETVAALCVAACVFAFTAALLVPAGDALARTERGSAGLHFGVQAPSGDFGKQVDGNGYGGTVEGYWNIGRESPLAIGLRGGYFIYGHDDYKVPLSPTIPGVWVDVETNNNLVTGMLLLRLQAWQGDVRPYGEGFLGLNYLYTNTSVKSEATGATFAESNNFDDTAFLSGLGGGLEIRLASQPRGSVYLDLGVSLVRGGRARYLTEGDIEVVDNVPVYTVHDSYTNTVLYRIGVMFGFR